MGNLLTDCHIFESSQDNEEYKIDFDGDKFILPNSLVFDRQSTFIRVQNAAIAFCQKNKILPLYAQLLTRIIAYRHQDTFQKIWAYLKPEQRQDFLFNLNSIEHDLMDSFYHHFILSHNRGLSRGRSAFYRPQIISLSQKNKQQWQIYGKKLIEQNKVAMVFMCAGSSSRFGSDKFLFPLNQQQTTIFDLMFLRLRRNAGTNISIIINCSEENIQRIFKYLKFKKYYGFNPNKITCFESISLAMFNQQGQYCFDQYLKFMKQSVGTSYSATHLANPLYSSNFPTLQAAEYLCFSGMENIMENPCDPLFVGMVALQNRQLGAKCAQAKFCEKLPRYYRTEKNSSKICLLEESNAQHVFKEIENLPIGINSMVINITFLREIVSNFNRNLFLAEHYEVMQHLRLTFNPRLQQCRRIKCLSFERDIRLFVNCCQNPLIYKIDRQKEFAPIFSKNNEYSLEAAYKNYAKTIDQDMKQLNMQSGNSAGVIFQTLISQCFNIDQFDD